MSAPAAPAEDTDKADDAKSKDEEKSDESKDDKKTPLEFGAKNDFQLNQALNLLKGLQFLQTH